MKNITFIGSGNLAFRFSLELRNKGYNIIQVYNRSEKNAKELSSLLNCDWTTDISNLKKTDLFIVCVKDDAIKEVVSKIRDKKTPIVHTSGSVDLNVFKDNISFGVIYPLQTFNKDIPIDFNKIPLFIEANNKNLEKDLSNLAKNISTSSQVISSNQRKNIHLAAVFACNFSNHMVTISKEILDNHKIDFNILRPIIQQTIDKIKNNSPKNIQTGPAIRKDKKIIRKHINMLEEYPEIQLIYSKITDHIINSNE